MFQTKIKFLMAAALCVMMTISVQSEAEEGQVKSEFELAGPPNLDVVGLALGTSQDEAISFLEQRQPQMKILKLQHANEPNVPYLAGVSAGSQNAGATENLGAMFTMIDGKAWFVGRNYNFAPNARPSVGTLVDALSAKYGAASVVDERRNIVRWGYDFEGNLITSAPTSKKVCGVSSNNIMRDVHSSAAQSVSIPTSFNTNCSLYIELRFRLANASSTDYMAGIVSNISIGITDLNARVADVEAVAEAKANKASAIKPEL